MKKRSTIAMFVLAASCAGGLAAETECKHPVAVIPYAATKPVIDGKVDDAEWQGAFSQRALQTTGKQISARQARVWMIWDEENLYIAMRDPLRPGERLLQSQRRDRGPDPALFADDLYEIWISVDATDPISGNRHCSSQFLANFHGARYDALAHPGFGSSFTTNPGIIVVAGHRPNTPGYGNAGESTYESGWEPKSRITDRNEWEMELVIPRASLGTTKGPFHDGMRFRTLFARNYQRPAEQNSFEGTSFFSDIDTHSEVVMSKTAPALHLLGVGDAAAGKIGLHLAAFGQTDAKIAWRYASDAVTKEGAGEVKKGTLAEVVNLPELDTPGDQKAPGKVRITVTDAKGATLLDWQSLRSFGPIPKDEIKDRGDVLNLGITFNPVRDYARVFGDFTAYANRGAIKEIVIVVSDAAGKQVKRATTTLDADAYAKAVLHFENLALGAYTVRLEWVDKDGKVVVSKDSTFAKEDLAKKYEWWNTPRGSIEKVVSPWTPVTLKGNTLGVWGREMEIGAAGIPSRVTTQGKEILAAPGRLVATLADGKDLTAEGLKAKTRFDQDHRKIVEVESKLADIAVTSEVRAEFDGMYKVTMTLTPKKPIGVKKLKIVLPYSQAMAEYLHAATTGIRGGFSYGFTPKGEGRVWDCRALGDKTMRVGSFIPYLWLGSTKGGLCWFADSDEGWIPTDETPAIEIQRSTDGQVDLVLNLISSEATLDAPRTITFALQASPVKQMHKGWREDKWWAGDTFKSYSNDQALQQSSPWVKANLLQRGIQMVRDQHNAGRLAIPYFVHTRLPWHAPLVVREMRDNLMEEWIGSSAGQALCYGGSLNDYMVFHWSRFAEQCGIDGCYLDNVTPYPCDNLEHGCGYRLPDGRVQPTFRMFGTREYFLRLRSAFLEQRQACKIVLHMSNHMIVPWVGAADVAYDGAQHAIFPEMKQDFMDLWPLDRLRADWPSQWGTAVNFMHQYQGEWDPRALHLAMRAYFAAVMLHDALPTGNHDGHAQNLIAMRQQFGIGEDDVRFLAYWDETGLKAQGDDIKLAGWQRPGKLLLLVANFGEKQTAQVAFDLDKLGWKGATLAVSDPEQGTELSAHGKDGTIIVTHDAPAPELDGTKLTVPVERHNYRLLVVEKK
ncbi:MAG: hypothetical protein FJ291_08495 [Planctomycetes bacterium]|nr:hypothetical protein [Planctomycetota bacterium]